ncbi:MAG: hypothetical protein E6I94_11190, partial [Chloroflexi bacterium]
AGTTVGAYALTEPTTGSDAQAIRTRATREANGSWRLDGTKQFITNAGFADLFTVYAKVDGGAFSAAARLGCRPPSHSMTPAAPWPPPTHIVTSP